MYQSRMGGDAMTPSCVHETRLINSASRPHGAPAKRRPGEVWHGARNLQPQTESVQLDPRSHGGVWAALRREWAGPHHSLGSSPP